MLIHRDRGDTPEPGGVVDQDPLALGQHSVVGGVSRHREPLSDPDHRQVLDGRAGMSVATLSMSGAERADRWPPIDVRWDFGLLVTVPRRRSR